MDIAWDMWAFSGLGLALWFVVFVRGRRHDRRRRQRHAHTPHAHSADDSNQADADLGAYELAAVATRRDQLRGPLG